MTPLWSAPADVNGAESLGDLALARGERYSLRKIATGDEAATGTSAEAYRLWYRIALANRTEGWVQAAVPTTNDIGSDGRLSSVRFDFLPAVVAG
jgi:hypothetical protein